jgi:Fe-S-cluster containining protein
MGDDRDVPERPPRSPEELRVFQLGEVVRRAMHASYQMISQEAQEGVRQAIDGRALALVLVSKGIITADELEAAREAAEREITEERADRWKGPWLTSKEAAEGAEAVVDCAARHSQCQAGCCTFYRVYLTAEEVEGHELKWDLAIPYAIPRGPDGRCLYLDVATLRCRVFANRPAVCRKYTCEDDKEIWDDFANMVPTERVRQLARQRAMKADTEGAGR